jgi:hypothetical protein
MTGQTLAKPVIGGDRLAPDQLDGIAKVLAHLLPEPVQVECVDQVGHVNFRKVAAARRREEGVNPHFA